MRWFKNRSVWALFKQWDLHAVLTVVLIDLGLTVHGISTNQGSEQNPFYIPFTESFELMLLGIGIYVAIILLLSLTLAGSLRYMVASFGFGMHVFGLLTWSHLVAPAFYDLLNVFWLAVAGTAATALFYWLETVTHRSKQRQSS